MLKNVANDDNMYYIYDAILCDLTLTVADRLNAVLALMPNTTWTVSVFVEWSLIFLVSRIDQILLQEASVAVLNFSKQPAKSVLKICHVGRHSGWLLLGWNNVEKWGRSWNFKYKYTRLMFLAYGFLYWSLVMAHTHTQTRCGSEISVHGHWR